jgi:hypothetical protein
MLGDAARRTPVVLLVLLSGLMVAGAEAFGVGIAARHYNLLVRQVRHYNLLARQVRHSNLLARQVRHSNLLARQVRHYSLLARQVRHSNLLVRQVRHYNLLARQVSWGVYRCDVWTTVVSGIVPWKA